MLTALLPATAPCGPVCTVPVIVVSVVGSLISVFRDWLARGELKIAATAKAENYVESIWGTLEPNSPPSSDSVSKLIEACQLDAAQELIAFLARQMSEKAAQDSYFQKWAIEYGALTLRQIQSKLDAYRGYCMVQQEPPAPSGPSCPSNFELVNGICKPVSCPPGFYLSGSICAPLSPPTLPPVIDNGGNYVPISEASNSNMLLLLAAAAVAVVVISR